MPDRTRLVAALLGTALIATSLPAAAHGAFGSAAPFWLGVLHVAVSPLAIAAIVGFGAAVARPLNEPVVKAVALGALIAGLNAWLLPPSLAPLATLGVLILGVIAILGREVAAATSLALALCAGVGVGASVELDTRGWAEGLGVAGATLIALIWAVELLARLKSRVPLACRVIGAWIAAIALLLAALALRAGPLRSP